ncbi:hypothetical protein TNCV_3769641 [Trichonephila clavipes]|nr:hypothetical protein TNCV_3769641 [Trichonephila clavipes]
MDECLPAGIKTCPGEYPQCQSDGSINRPSIWCTRYGYVVDLSRAGQLFQRTNGFGMKTRSTCVQIRYPRQLEIIGGVK